MEGVWNLLIERGVTTEELSLLKHSYLLLLMLPLISTLIGVARHFIGIKSLSVYLPIIITFAFYEISIESEITNEPDILRGVKVGIILFFLVFFTAAVTYYGIVKTLRMHYIPKSSLVITAVSISVISFLILGSYLGKTGILFINFFTLIMLSSLSERFFAIFAKKKFRYAFVSSIQTLVLSLIAFVILVNDTVKDTLINYPWIVLVTILLNIYIGRFVGLRLTEYWRFRSILFKEEIKDDRQFGKK